MDIRFLDYIKADGRIGLPEDKGILQKWNSCASIKVSVTSNNDKRRSFFQNNTNLVVLNRIRQRTISLDTKIGIYPGNNSGYGALMLAIALGFKKIFLLGYDMKISNGRTHFHEGYPNQQLRVQERHLSNFKRLFEATADSIKKIGIEVVNLTPDSALTCFPMGKLEGCVL
jgi:hypothetical protein